ncbi:unnamed protein product [Jaminaea pallidilutea]
MCHRTDGICPSLLSWGTEWSLIGWLLSHRSIPSYVRRIPQDTSRHIANKHDAHNLSVVFCPESWGGSQLILVAHP